MSQNINRNDPSNPSKTTGSAGTGATDLGTTRDTHDSSTGLTTTGSSTATGTAKAKADNLSGQAQEYGQKIADQAQEYGQKFADAATQAKDFVSDKVTVVGDKLKDLQNKDFTQVAEDAKQYARERPGQALIISAAAGFLIGLLLRNSRR